MNCSLTIAVKIVSQSIQFVLQMRINKGLLILTKLQNSLNYPHIGHILLRKCKMILVERLGDLNSRIGQTKILSYPHVTVPAVCHTRACFCITYMGVGENVRVT